MLTVNRDPMDVARGASLDAWDYQQIIAEMVAATPSDVANNQTAVMHYLVDLGRWSIPDIVSALHKVIKRREGP